MSYLTKEQKEAIFNLLDLGLSSRKVAKEVLGRESAKSTINDLKNRSRTKINLLNYNKAVNEDYNKAKLLFIDVETKPLMGALWSLWQNGIALNQLQSDWHILSFTAKWAHSDELIYMDKRDSFDTEDDKEMLQKIWELMDEADFVCGHNTKKFDVKKIFSRFILNGMGKPSAFRHIDTLLIAKSLFGFTSNKLEYLTDKLCTKYKKSTHKKFPGYLLWKECLAGNPEAWEEMEDYNKFDVLSNQELYEVFMPWDAKLPNFDLYVDEEMDMSDWVENGYHYSNLGKYQLYRNRNTGQQRRGRVNLLSKEKRASLLANIV